MRVLADEQHLQNLSNADSFGIQIELCHRTIFGCRTIVNPVSRCRLSHLRKQQTKLVIAMDVSEVSRQDGFPIAPCTGVGNGPDSGLFYAAQLCLGWSMFNHRLEAAAVNTAKCSCFFIGTQIAIGISVYPEFFANAVLYGQTEYRIAICPSAILDRKSSLGDCRIISLECY